MPKPFAPGSIRPAPIELLAVTDARGMRLHDRADLVRVRAGMYAAASPSSR